MGAEDRADLAEVHRSAVQTLREPLAEAARKVMPEIPVTGLAPGALILFRMRERAVAKHCGILVAADHFVHAYERTGVIEERLDAAWRRRLAFAFLFPAM